MLTCLCPSRQAGLGGRGAPGAGRRSKLRGLDQLVKGTQHPLASSIQNMGVNHRGAHVLMPEQFLHRADVITRLQQMGGEGMPKTEQLPGLTRPAARTACFTARCKTVGSM
jgi:hypothetical protein